MQCCYCERELTIGFKSPTRKTKEHVIPRSKGGMFSKTIPCCHECNQERNNFDLDVWIFILNKTLSELKPGVPDYIRTETKIKNAQKILSEINNYKF